MDIISQDDGVKMVQMFEYAEVEIVVAQYDTVPV